MKNKIFKNDLKKTYICNEYPHESFKLIKKIENFCKGSSENIKRINIYK